MYFHERTIDQAQAFNTLHWDTNGIGSGITPIVYSPFGNSVLGPNACLTAPAGCASNYNNFYGQPGQTTLVQGLYPNIGVDRASWNMTDSFGVYGQGTYTPPILSDRIHLTGGVRWNEDRKHGNLLVVNNALPFLPDASGQLTNVQGVIDRSKTWARVDPMVNAAFDVTETVSLYAKYSTGYRAGGFNSRSITYSAYDPEEITMYEAGMKSEFFDHRLRVNVKGYAGDYKNAQLQHQRELQYLRHQCCRTVGRGDRVHPHHRRYLQHEGRGPCLRRRNRIRPGADRGPDPFGHLYLRQ